MSTAKMLKFCFMVGTHPTSFVSGGGYYYWYKIKEGSLYIMKEYAETNCHGIIAIHTPGTWGNLQIVSEF